MMETQDMAGLPKITVATANTYLIVVENGEVRLLNAQYAILRRETPADLNDATETGYYQVHTPVLNLPAGAPNYGALLVLKDGTSGKECVQMYLAVSNTGHVVYTRKYGITLAKWSPWVRMTGEIMTS